MDMDIEIPGGQIDEPQPTLISIATFSDGIIFGRVLQYLRGGSDMSLNLLALEMSCRALKDELSDDRMWYVAYGKEGYYRGGLTAVPADSRLATWRETSLRSHGLKMIRRAQVRSKNNAIMHYLGGADGFRRLADELLRRMRALPLDESRPLHKMTLRGDTIGCVSHLLQESITIKVRKALEIAIFRSSNDEYPKIEAKDFGLIDNLLRTESLDSDRDPYITGCCSVFAKSHTCSRHCAGMSMPAILQPPDPQPGWQNWTWPDDDCRGLLDDNARRGLINWLIARGGAIGAHVSMDAYTLLSTELLHLMGMLLVDAFEASKGNSGYHEEIEESIPHGRVNEDLFLHKFCPPLQVDENGNVECIVIPRQIEDAASRLGLPCKKVLGFPWYASEENSVEEEKAIAMAQYPGLQSTSTSIQDYSGSDSDSSSDDDYSEYSDTSYTNFGPLPSQN